MCFMAPVAVVSIQVCIIPISVAAFHFTRQHSYRRKNRDISYGAHSTLFDDTVRGGSFTVQVNPYRVGTACSTSAHFRRTPRYCSVRVLVLVIQWCGFVSREIVRCGAVR